MASTNNINKPTVQQYGWFSAKQEKKAGSAIWNNHGKPVIVTLVTSSIHKHESNWSDIMCVGSVDEYVGKHITGEYGDILMDRDDWAFSD
jgi:hypothetical protein